jgi:PAS domain S-box-containing protein
VSVGEPQENRIKQLEQQYEALRARTRALFDAYPDLIFRLDGESRILDFHAADRTVLAAPPENFLGRRVEEVFDSEFAASVKRCIEAAFETKKVQAWEYSLPLRGKLLHFEARIVPSGRDEVLSIVRDITEQRRAREQLLRTESRLNHAQAVAKIGSWERDLATNEVWWSDETFHLLGLDPRHDQASYAAVLERLQPGDRPHVLESVQEAIDQRRPYFGHLRLVLPDGTRKTVSSRAHVVLDTDGVPARLVGTIQDITDRDELEREILATGERERERVGRDLHDGLGQTLTGISLSLKAIANRLERGQEAPIEMLRQLERHVQEAMHETRRVAHLLSPRMAGLGAALEALVRQFDRDGLRCTIHAEMRHDAHDSEVEMHLYRIAQEAVSNAVRHSNARNIELHYRCNGSSIRLEVLDDGVGLPRTRETEGIGLRNMRYRVHMINGNLDVEDRAGGGTKIVCSCPCRTEPSWKAQP